MQALANSYGIATELIELRNLITVGTHIVEAALLRKESRGGHFSLDYPPIMKTDKEAPAMSPPSKRWKNYSRKSSKEPDAGSLVRGSSPPRSHTRDVVIRSQKDSQDRTF